MEPLGSIQSIPPKAAGSSRPTASTGKTVMLLSAKLREKLPGKQRSGCSASVLVPAASGPEFREGACWELPHPVFGTATRARTMAGGCWALPAWVQFRACPWGAGSRPAERAQRMGLRGDGGVQRF